MNLEIEECGLRNLDVVRAALQFYHPALVDHVPMAMHYVLVSFPDPGGLGAGNLGSSRGNHINVLYDGIQNNTVNTDPSNRLPSCFCMQINNYDSYQIPRTCTQNGKVDNENAYQYNIIASYT